MGEFRSVNVACSLWARKAGAGGRTGVIAASGAKSASKKPGSPGLAASTGSSASTGAGPAAEDSMTVTDLSLDESHRAMFAWVSLNPCSDEVVGTQPSPQRSEPSVKYLVSCTRVGWQKGRTLVLDKLDS